MEKCKACNKVLDSVPELVRHIMTDHKMTTEAYTVKYLYDGKRPVCPECGKTTRYVQFQFRTYCKEHANLARAKSCKEVGKLPSWNKGQTKETNEILRKQAESFKGEGNHFFGKHHSEETIEKLRNQKLLTEEEYYARTLTRCSLPNEEKKKEFVLLTPYSEYLSRQHQCLQLQCTKCGTVDKKTLQAFERQSKCKVCYPIQKNSREEQEVKDFVRSVCACELIENSKQVIPPVELDLYVPEKKLAIEYNGLYWHTEESKSKSYHKDKTVACAAKGIRLFHIFSDEWRDKQPILKSMIAYRLGVLTNRVSARNCEIRQLTTAEAKQFFDLTHISGWTHSRIVFGLIDDDNSVVAALGLRVPQQKAKYPNALEISRFSNKLDTIVNGSFAKLLEKAKAYAVENDFTSLITYADLRFGDGSVYVRNGFEELQESVLDYWYTDGAERYPRFSFRATKEKSEKVLALEANVSKIYGCGSKRYRLKL